MLGSKPSLAVVEAQAGGQIGQGGACMPARWPVEGPPCFDACVFRVVMQTDFLGKAGNVRLSKKGWTCEFGGGIELNKAKISSGDGLFVQEEQVAVQPLSYDALGVADGVVEAVVPDARAVFSDSGEEFLGIGSRERKKVAGWVSPAEGLCAVDAS